MIKTVTKSDGSTEPFDIEKLRKWGEWADVVGVNYQELILKTFKKISSEVISSDELHNLFIQTSLEQEDEAHSRLAGRLYLGTVYKRCFGHHDNIPELSEFYHSMVRLGYWEDMSYSEDELDYIEENIIDHQNDKTYTHSQLRQIADKYAVKDKVSNTFYESPQFTFIRMSMALAKDEPDYVVKLKLVEDYYVALAVQQTLNAPTPNYVNLGTPNKGYASCCLVAQKDTAKSIATGHYIADQMTCASAGIGTHLKSRSKGDAVKGGTISHNGKLPYYRALQASVKANVQSSRGGGATTYITCNDPEVYDLIKARSVTTPQEKRVGGIDYALSHCEEFRNRVANNEDWPLFSYGDYPDLYEAMYEGDQSIFKNKLEAYEAIANKFTYVDARETMLAHLKEEYETGRSYEFNMGEVNRHTSFKEKIYQSNLCVAPETELVINHLGKLRSFEIQNLETGDVNIWNGSEWSKVTVEKTGENQKLLTVVVVTIENNDLKSLSYEVNKLDCTEYHKWYDSNGAELRTIDLERFTELESFIHPVSGHRVEQVVVDVVDTGRYDDTYCFTEPKRNRGVFNGILTGNCNEINQPTKGYDNVDQLFVKEESGEVSLCTLFAVIVSHLKLELNLEGKGFTQESVDEYMNVAYLGVKMVDNVIEMMDYPFPQLEFTAKARRNMGAGISGLAELMAKNKLMYSSKEGRDFIHMLSELHSFAVHSASLRLAKERGVCEWAHKTKYPDGWLPIDTYNKNVDSVVDNTLYLDWEGLRSDIIETGGLRTSSCVSHMPCESSSISSFSTNGSYSVRDRVVVKGDATKGVQFIAPNWEKYGNYYEIAWDIPTKRMFECYAIIQKFTDQGISIDAWEDKNANGKFSGDEALDNFLYGAWLGLKGKYYTNSRNNGKLIDFGDSGCEGGACKM